MTNEQYLNIEGIIYSVVRKYNTPLLSQDDLVQICAEYILLHENDYNESKMKYTSYIYSLCKWAIDKELSEIQRKEAAVESVVSLYATFKDTEDTTIEDTIADVKIDIEKLIEDKIMAEYYYNIINSVLCPCEAMTLILKAFYNFDYKTIVEQVPSISSNSQVTATLQRARTHLIQRSPIMRSEYKQLIGYSEYKTERVAICNSV